MENKISSFHYNNLEIQLHKEVYDPAEDTFLLLETIDVHHDDAVFEIGTGTGIIALFCAQKKADVICSDINPYAIYLTQKNITRNKQKLQGSIQVRKGSLFSVLKDGEQFNLIIFNPPYLPTSENEYIGGTGWFDKAVSGGRTGLDLTTQYLRKLSAHLKPLGRAFTLFSSNSPRDQFHQILKQNNLDNTIISSRSFIDETIEVHKITKK